MKTASVLDSKFKAFQTSSVCNAKQFQKLWRFYLTW